MTTTDRKEFLQTSVPELLKNLKADSKPNFGLMSAQHMIEHLVMIVKTTMKRYGEPPAEPTKSHLGFKRFISKGAVFQHRPSDKTEADLPALKYASLEEAMAQVAVATERFYKKMEEDPDFKSFNPMMGELSIEELELFHYQHFRYHFWQFGLIDKYDS